MTNRPKNIEQTNTTLFGWQKKASHKTSSKLTEKKKPI
jgi:hypothetical protein